MSYLGAIGAAQREAMKADPRVVVIGEEVVLHPDQREGKR
jgi:pyruvate/2-oxoglutarate/acetoin dehydrogenase E1 component